MSERGADGAFFCSAYIPPSFGWVPKIPLYHRMDVGMDSSNIFC